LIASTESSAVGAFFVPKGGEKPGDGMSQAPGQARSVKSTALKFVVLVGVMSFFADFTYEGSRGIIGPYLALLGAGAAAIAIITGFGELLGYGLRLVSGRFSDQ